MCTPRIILREVLKQFEFIRDIKKLCRLRTQGGIVGKLREEVRVRVLLALSLHNYGLVTDLA